MILNNATADIPAAGTAGAHDFDTTLLLPLYDDGTSKVPYRFNIQIPLFVAGVAAQTAVLTPSTGGTFDDVGGANRVTIAPIDFTRFRQARVYCRGNATVSGGGSITLRIRDLTNSLNVGGATPCVWNASGWADKLGAWTNLNATTYTTPDCYIGAQVTSVNAGDTIELGAIHMELR